MIEDICFTVQKKQRKCANAVHACMYSNSLLLVTVTCWEETESLSHIGLSVGK